jgi:hypothetical protein
MANATSNNQGQKIVDAAINRFFSGKAWTFAGYWLDEWNGELSSFV